MRFEHTKIYAILASVVSLMAGPDGVARAQAWSSWTELMPYESSRATSAIPDIRPAPPVTASDYQAFADEVFSGATCGGSFSTPANKYKEALRAARYYRLYQDSSCAAAAIQAASDHLAHINATEQAGDDFIANGVHLYYAARTYTLLRDGLASIPVNDWEQVLYDWLVKLDQEVPSPMRKLGPKGQALSVALGDAALAKLCAEIQGSPCSLPAADHADAVWADWYTAGDVAENSDQYRGLDMLYVIWWLQLDPSRSANPSNPLEDPKVVALAEYTLQQMTTLGPAAHVGDGSGFAAGSKHYPAALESWASATGDGRFRSAAQTLFGFLRTHKSEMDQWGSLTTDVADNALEAAIAVAETVGGPAQAVVPESGSQALARSDWAWESFEVYQDTRRDIELIPGQQSSDKLVFRSGWSEDDGVAVIETARKRVHGHYDAGALNTYVAKGSVLLQSNGYRIKDAYYHNALSIDPPEYPNDDRRIPWQNGARSADVAAGPGVIHVTFSAKRISGSPYIGMYRPHTGGATRVEISDEWQTYEVDWEASYANQPILFVPLASWNKNDTDAVDGEFLLDDVLLTMDSPPPGSDLPKLFKFDDATLDGWSALDEHFDEDKGECSPGARDPSCAIETTHETVDVATGAGALRVSVDIGTEVERDTPDAHASAFDAFDDFGYGTVSLPGHLGKPFDVERRVVFLGDTGIWVRDEVEATGSYQATIGPGWHLAAVADENAPDGWARGAQTAVAVGVTTPDCEDPEPRVYFMHWQNRPRDLLVKFHSSAQDAVLHSADVKAPPAEIIDGDGYECVRTPFEKRVSFDIDRVFSPGERVAISSFLRPHAPVVDGAEIAGQIDWLIDSEDLSIVEIAGDEPWKSTVVGINHTGACVDVPGYELSTDAAVFRVQYGVNGIVAFDVVDATALGQGECGGGSARSLVDLASADSVHHRGLPGRAANPDFEDDIDDWTPQVDGSTGLAIVDLSHVDGALFVDMENGSTGPMPRSHRAGVAPTIGSIGPQSTVRIEFDARRLSPAPVELSAQRQWGGSSRQSVPIDEEWRRYRLSFEQDYAAASVIFAPVAIGATGAFPRTEEASFMLDDVVVSEVPNLVVNAGFDGPSADGWQSLAATSISLETVDVVLGPALRVAIPVPDPGSIPPVWDSGAKAAVQSLPEHSRVRVSFHAKSISGSTCLAVRSPSIGVPGGEVQIDGSWDRYVAELDYRFDGAWILFNVCDPSDGAELLIDNVVVDEIESRLINGDFDDDVEGWDSQFDGTVMTVLDDLGGPGVHLYRYPDPAEPSAPTLLMSTVVGSPAPAGNVTGAVARLRDGDVIESGPGVHVSFTARVLAGSGLLRVGLTGDPSGSSEVVQLTGERETFRVDLDGEASDILFSSVASNGDAAGGLVVIDDVVVTSRH